MPVTRFPSVFVSHGSPMMIVEDSPARQFLQGLGETLGRPSAILIASGHWLTEGLGIVAADRPETIYDFQGFPAALYEIAYRAPGAPDLAERARAKKLNPDEVQGGTFTITNPGIFGGLFGLPIINQPQVAIMGIGGIKKRPVVIDDAIAIRSMMYLSLSYDHRVVDGAVADQFLARVQETLQNFDEAHL